MTEEQKMNGTNDVDNYDPNFGYWVAALPGLGGAAYFIWQFIKHQNDFMNLAYAVLCLAGAYLLPALGNMFGTEKAAEEKQDSISGEQS